MKGKLFVHRIDTEESHRRGAGLPIWRACPVNRTNTEKAYKRGEASHLEGLLSIVYRSDTDKLYKKGRASNLNGKLFV